MTRSKWIDGYEGHYKITDCGDVISCKKAINYKDGRVATFTEKKLKQSTNWKGYHVVYLSKNSTKKTIKVHRLVALAFIPVDIDRPQVNHIDGVKTNNRVTNLEWCNNSENQKHAYKLGLNVSNPIKGELNHAAKMSRKKVIECRKLYSKGNTTYGNLAVKYGISVGSISDIIKNRTWKHVKTTEI